MDSRSSFTATGGDCPKQRTLLHEEFKQTLIQESKVTKSSWTDEKHSMYLKSIEASFVEELYSSLDLFGFHSKEEELLHPMLSHRRKQHGTNVPSGQYKVLRDGCWGKIEFGSQKSQQTKANQSGGLSQNPWIRRFRPTNTNKVVTSCNLQEKSAIQHPEVPVYSRHAMNPTPSPATSDLCCDTEGTDQNFEDDDDVEGEKEVSNTCSAKKMKTSLASASNKNQVVPVGNYSMTKEITSPSSSERMDEDSYRWSG